MTGRSSLLRLFLLCSHKKGSDSISGCRSPFLQLRPYDPMRLNVFDKF